MPIVPDLVLPGPARFLEARLTDAVLDMANKLIGGLFARARKARERGRYVAGTRNVGRLMRLFHGTIEALGTVQYSERDDSMIVDEAVGWARLLRVHGEIGRTPASSGSTTPLPAMTSRPRYRTSLNLYWRERPDNSQVLEL